VKALKIIAGVVIGAFAGSLVVQQILYLAYYPDAGSIAISYSRIVIPTLIVGAIIGGICGLRWWWQNVVGWFVVASLVITLSYLKTTSPTPQASALQPSIWATCVANLMVCAENVGDQKRALTYTNSANEIKEDHDVSEVEYASELLRISDEFERGNRSWKDLTELSLGCVYESRLSNNP